jgi:DNA-binding NtrC family response regulator
MTKVLIVEDETTSRNYLEQALLEDGYEVRAASSGRSGIQLGRNFAPDVLVADWMLKNTYHGLEVAQALHQVNPSLLTILVTGFPSDDLKEEAAEIGVFRFIEKPFALAELEEAVSQAAASPRVTRQTFLGVVELAGDGAIRFANEQARNLFARTRAGRDASSVHEILPAEVMGDLAAAQRAWLAVSPLSEEGVAWRLRLGPAREDGSRPMILRDVSEASFGNRQVVEALLEVEESAEPSWPFPGGVLIVDPERSVRRVFVRLLRTAGAVCFAAASHLETLRLLEADRRLRFVILDRRTEQGNLDGLLAEIARLRPDVVVVGTSAEPHANDFAALGVERFLRKPWTLRELTRLLTSRPLGASA